MDTDMKEEVLLDTKEPAAATKASLWISLKKPDETDEKISFLFTNKKEVSLFFFFHCIF